VHWILNTICRFHFQSRENGQCHVFCSACPYSKIGVVRTVQNSHVTVFCSIALVFLKSGVLRTVDAATCSKKMPVVVESTFELEFTRTAAVKVRSSVFYYNIIYSSKTKTWCNFAVVFVCTVQCFTTENIFFRSNNIRRHKNGFLWL
jgi:hypothetical protein